MPTIEQTYEMKASPEQVFEALVNPDIIQDWSGDEAKMGAEVGSTFSLWGGQMYGTNIEVVKNKKLVQEWCYDQWEKPSKVTFTLKGKGETTTVELLHEDVPEKSVNSIADGWGAYYLGAIQEMFDEANS
ncbi:MAG: SRPBCC domain-containing protein [Bacteroidetes bacterium]|nr:SRPBCC domain-containing protein [Bacteroidota bacterium]